MPEPSPRHGVAVAEARQLLVEQGWVVTRWIGLRSPPDLFAIGRNAYLLVMVRTSRRLLPDAHAVSIRYHDDLERMRTMRVPPGIRLECWVLAGKGRWTCYEIYPGGIRRCWREGVAPEAEDTPEPEADECAAGREGSIPAPETSVDDNVRTPVMEGQ